MSEKGDMSGDTVSLPPTYAPSEAYTESPPPAYQRAKSTTVQIARMVCITLLAAAFMIGFFTLTSNYLSAKECNCHNQEGHKHGGLHSASVLPQVEKLVGEEGLNKVEEMNGNGLDVPEEPIISKDIIQQEMEEVAVPNAQEELDDNIPEEEVEALVEEVAELEEAERELEEEMGSQDILQEQIEEMKKKIKLPIDLILGNPSLAGRDVNCEVERRQQPIGGGIVTQAIIVTCSDDNDDDNNEMDMINGPGLIMSPPGPRRMGPPLSLLAPIMKMLSSRARARAERPIEIRTMAAPPQFSFNSGPKPCSPNGPFPCFMNQGKSLGPLSGPFSSPNNGPFNGPFPGSNGPFNGRNGPFPGPNGPFPVRNGPFPVRNGPFPLGNSPFSVRDGPFPVGDGPFPIRDGPFPLGNGPFPERNGPYPVGNGPFPVGNGPFPGNNGPFPGPMTGPNFNQISRHIHMPMSEPKPIDLPSPFQRPAPFFQNAPILSSGPRMPMQENDDNDDEPRNRMLPIALRPMVRLSQRMPRILALAARPERQGLITPISSLQRGANNNISPREPRIISNNPHPLPEAQGRALPSPISLPGLRLLPARILSAPSFMRGLRRDDSRLITHMEMRKLEPENRAPDFEPRFPDFGPPRVETVIGPKQPNPFNQFTPATPPKIGNLSPSEIISKIIEINHRTMNKDIMTSPKPIAVINKIEPIAGTQFPIFPPPPPPPPSSLRIPPPPFKMDPSGRVGIPPSVNPDAEFIVHSEHPPTPQSFPGPQISQLIAKEVYGHPQQPEDDRKHHLLIVN